MSEEKLDALEIDAASTEEGEAKRNLSKVQKQLDELVEPSEGSNDNTNKMFWLSNISYKLFGSTKRKGSHVTNIDLPIQEAKSNDHIRMVSMKGLSLHNPAKKAQRMLLILRIQGIIIFILIVIVIALGVELGKCKR